MSEIIAQEKKPAKSSYSLTANMFITFIITFAAGTMCFESYMPELFVTIYSFAVIVICLITWLVLSFVSGKKKKWQFAVYSAVFWILPQIVIYLADSGPEAFRKSIAMYLLSEFCSILVTAPIKAIGTLINVKVLPFAFIIVLMCVFSFLLGYLTIKEPPKDAWHQN